MRLDISVRWTKILGLHNLALYIIKYVNYCNEDYLISAVCPKRQFIYIFAFSVYDWLKLYKAC